jgi:putative nucleotidyltransferase with HDIG domain
LVVIAQQIGAGALAIILPILLVLHLTLRASFGRLEDAHQHVRQIDRLYRSTVETLAMAIDAKDDVTHSHVRRVQAYAAALARELGVTDEVSLKAIEAAALLHDTGKLGIPERILNKPGGLTPSEFEEMKRHVDIGADILSLVDFPYPVVPIVRCHHENWDGTGYPRGVKAEAIPIGARILSVVDCFDALTSDRPYRKALSDEAALDILRERRGRMYDPTVVDTFIAIYRDVAVADATASAEHQIFKQLTQGRGEPAAAPDVARTPNAAPAPVNAGEDVLAFVSLSRLAAGAGTLADVLALGTKLVRGLVGEASGAWYIAADGADKLTVVDAFGSAAGALRGRAIRMSEGLTGWVASNRQVIVNSDASLDIPGAAGMNPVMSSCLSVPLIDGSALAGVLTLYAPKRNAFTDDQGRLVQMIAPHIAQAILLVGTTVGQRPVQSSRDLKLVSSR